MLLTVIILALGTPWGLFRHYWVLFKLVLTALAILILLQDAQTVSYFSSAATQPGIVGPDGLQSYILQASGSLLVLLVATVLSVHKPRGMIRYG